MKKILFIGLVVCTLFLASCTQDTDGGEGIFEQVVTQNASSSYRIKQYLGNKDEQYYFIEERGLFCNGTNLQSGNFANGWMKDDDTIYLLNNDNSKVYKYSISGKTFDKQTFSSDNFNQITDSGFAVSSKKAEDSTVTITGIYDLKTGSPVNIATSWDSNILGKFSYVLSSEDAILIESYKYPGDAKENSYYLYNRGDDSPNLVSGLSGKLIAGFQKVSNDTYYVVFTRNDNDMYNEIWKIKGTSATKIARSNYLYKDGYQCVSFYDDTGNGRVGFRSASRYEILDNAKGDSPIYQERYTGFASGIYSSDMELMNIKKKESSDGTFIFAFYKYGLFAVKPATDGVPVQLKL